MKRLHEFYTAGTGTALLVGNPQAAAINAPKGKKYDAWKDAYGNALVDRDIGGASGLVAGAGIGAGAGALVGRSNFGKRVAAKLSSGGDISERLAKFKIAKQAATPAGALVGGLAGLGLGGFAGLVHGHYGKRAQEIRNRHLSANLKPALRELAARSEAIKEFAMVRNADGQFVEDEGGMGVGTAVKAGAGAAALGGAGYGAYRGHKAVMGVGADEYAKKSAMAATAADRVGSTPIAQRAANYKIAKAGALGNFDRMGFMDKVKTGYGMAGQSAMNSAAGRSGMLGRLGRFALKLR